SITSSRTLRMDTQPCAANRRAAMVPAMDGVGRWANSSGTAMKPIADRLPSHRAARRELMTCWRGLMACSVSEVAHAGDFVTAHAARGLHFGRVALFLADQGSGDGAADVDQAQFQVGLVLAHD